MSTVSDQRFSENLSVRNQSNNQPTSQPIMVDERTIGGAVGRGLVLNQISQDPTNQQAQLSLISNFCKGKGQV